MMNFNPRTREGCDLHLNFPDCRQIPDFNPRTREGCDDEWRNGMQKLACISIHAPVKGATNRGRQYGSVPGAISIHAPVKGAT